MTRIVASYMNKIYIKIHFFLDQKFILTGVLKLEQLARVGSYNTLGTN